MFGLFRRPGVWGLGVLALVGACGDSADDDRDAGARLADPPSRFGRERGPCGDGVLDRGEACDGRVTAHSCSSLGMAPGPLSCTATCELDTSLCGTGPTRPDADGGPLIPSIVSVVDPAQGPIKACAHIVACDTLPLPLASDFGPDTNSPSSLALAVEAVCLDSISAPCASCELANLVGLGDDAGAGTCSRDCLPECVGALWPRADGLLDERCPSTATDFLQRPATACLCEHCGPPVLNCLLEPSCAAALLCVDASDCVGDACAQPAACGDAFTQASRTGIGAELLEMARLCLATQGC